MENTFLELETNQERIAFFGVHGAKKFEAMCSKLVKEFLPDHDFSKKYLLGFKVLEYTNDDNQKLFIYVEWVIKNVKVKNNKTSCDIGIEYMTVSYTGVFPELIAERVESFVDRHNLHKKQRIDIGSKTLFC